MSVQVATRSRLRFKELLSIQGVEFWELDALPTVPTQPDDVYYQVLDSDRIDLLATRFYGDPNMWWVIAIANDMNLLPTDLQIGSTIRIPSPAYVANTLFTRVKTQRR